MDYFVGFISLAIESVFFLTILRFIICIAQKTNIV